MHASMGIARLIVPGLALLLVVPLHSQQANDRQAQAPGLWIDAGGQPNARAIEALALIEEASGHGLSPAEYRPETLPSEDSLGFETALQDGLLRYVRDLGRGRVDPNVVGFHLGSRPDLADLPDLSTALRQAAMDGRLRAFVEEQAPHSSQYLNLQAALTHYQALAQRATALSAPAITGVFRLGDPYDGAAALHAFLVAVGDIPPDAPPPRSSVMTAELTEGLKRFQHRHELLEDGILGKRTMAALEVPLSQRVRQIELALERQRWLPHDVQGPIVVVNIPMFRLWAFEAGSSEAPLTMKVIVGCAVKTQTPIFTADLQTVVFRPYWNVPSSIVHGEILPRLKREPDYLTKNRFEIVRGQTDQAAVVPVSPQALDELAQGTLRLRQRPGQNNTLGLIKFDFPNPYTVYLHGTAAQYLFDQDARDLSHGCVRVEHPAVLAQWVLDDPDWSPAAITEAMAGANSRQVDVTRAVRIVLFYTTAAIAPDGQVHFAEDVYRLDALLERELERRRQAPTSSHQSAQPAELRQSGVTGRPLAV